MKHGVGLLLFLFIVHVQCLSILTDSSGQNITQLDTNDIDSKNVDVFRQLLNQETIIRIALVKNVHSLMKDMVDLKQNMETLETSQQKTEVEITALKQEVNELKRENERLKLVNRQCEETFNIVKENFTKLDEDFQRGLEQIEEKRIDFEKNTSTILGDLKVEVRYLSVTLLDLNKHTLEEIDRSIPEMVQEKYDILSLTLNSSLTNLQSDLLATNSRLTRSISNLENDQITIKSSIVDDFNKTIAGLQNDVKQSQYDQLKLSSTVSSLEVFRMNVTSNRCDLSKRVAFTAGVTSTSSSWNSGTLVFTQVINNVGGGYNPNTGIFTAPVDGDYVFYVSIQSYNHNHDIYVDIVLNGSKKVRAMAEVYTSDDAYETGTNLVTLPLDQGDTVWVNHYSGSGYYTYSDAPVTTFSGFLL
ncbi:multimerin-2-like [Saccostrea cucullata]|uniref:multimerin-2-like n=1 Tax=Saccostrea cuccullata TaxID=36930 RepID=UPI002ED1BBA5